MRTGIDHLVLEDYVLSKQEQGAFAEEHSWEKEFQLD
jgi:hypothetical protein